jgi:hypothetical protein
MISLSLATGRDLGGEWGRNLIDWGSPHPATGEENGIWNN